MHIVQALHERGYLPRYRLPRVAGCLLSALLVLTVFVGVLIFAGGPLLLSHLATLDTVPIVELAVGQSQSIGDYLLTLTQISDETPPQIVIALQHADHQNTYTLYPNTHGLSEPLLLPDGSLLRVIAYTPSHARFQLILPQ